MTMFNSLFSVLGNVTFAIIHSNLHDDKKVTFWSYLIRQSTLLLSDLHGRWQLEKKNLPSFLTLGLSSFKSSIGFMDN